MSQPFPDFVDTFEPIYRLPWPSGSELAVLDDGESEKSWESAGLWLKKTRDYSCLMLEMPSDLADKIIQIGRDRIADDALAADGREDWPHITVLYGFHTDSADAVLRDLVAFGPIQFTVGKISRFESEEYDVVKFDVESDDLTRLRKIVEQHPHTNTHAGYHPHITLAYVKKGTTGYSGKTELTGQTFAADNLVFSSRNETKTQMRLDGSGSLEKFTKEFANDRSSDLENHRGYLEKETRDGKAVLSPDALANKIFAADDWDKELIDRALPVLAQSACKAAVAQMRVMGVDLRRLKSSKNCGTGSGGFKPGNSCARGGGSYHRFELSGVMADYGRGHLQTPIDHMDDTLKESTASLKLTEDQRAAVVAYRKSEDGVWVNDALRGTKKHNDSTEKTLGHLDDVFNKSEARIGQSVVAYRGVSADFFGKLDSLKPGESITDPGFVSTSLNIRDAKAFAGRGGRVVEIEINAGQRAVGLDNALPPGGANELLLNRSSRFVLDRKTDDGVLVFRYRESQLDKAVVKSAGSESGRRFVWSFGDISKKSTASEWLDSLGGDSDIDFPDTAFSTPYGPVSMRIATEMPVWMKDKIKDHIEETFAQDYWHGMNVTTKDDIRDFLKMSIGEGWSIRDMADKIQTMLGGGDYAGWRARAIARTESGHALNGARSVSADALINEMGSYGLPVVKSWLSVLGTTTRKEHADLDGVPADKDGLWTLVGIKIRWPGDIRLPVQMRINCQCSLVVDLGIDSGTAQQLIDEYTERADKSHYIGQLKNCGTGSGGFKPGNQCARGGGSASDIAEKIVSSGLAESAKLDGMTADEAQAVYDGLKKSLTDVAGRQLYLRSVQFVENTPAGRDEGGLGYSGGHVYITKGFIENAKNSDPDKVRADLAGTGGERNFGWQDGKNLSERIQLAVAHEVGHHVDGGSLFLDMGKAVRNSGVVWTEADAVKVSGYASTHQSELFAELHAFKSIDRWDKIPPNLQILYTETLKTADPDPLFVRK